MYISDNSSTNLFCRETSVFVWRCSYNNVHWSSVLNSKNTGNNLYVSSTEDSQINQGITGWYAATKRIKYRPICTEVEICPKHIVKGKKHHKILRSWFYYVIEGICCFICKYIEKKIESKPIKLLTDFFMKGSGAGVKVKSDFHVYYVFFNVVWIFFSEITAIYYSGSIYVHIKIFRCHNDLFWKLNPSLNNHCIYVYV